MSTLTSTLTRDQIQKLDSEQQETLAAIELGRMAKRERLMREARDYPGRAWFSLVVFAITTGLIILSAHSQKGLTVFILGSVFVVVYFHTKGLRRRLDALLELIDPQLRRASESDEAED